MRLFTSIILLLILSCPAFAGPVVPNRKVSASAPKTNTIYAPLARQHEFIFGLTSPFGNIDATPLGSKADFTGVGARVGYAYGLADAVSMYARQQYSNIEVSYSSPNGSSKTSGIGDTTFGAKGIINVKKSFLYYDGSYSMALAEKYNYNTLTRESTAASVRPDMRFEGGAGVPVGPFLIGGTVTYHMYQEGDAQSTTGPIKTTTKEKAGTGLDWKIFGQLDMNWKLGLSYEEMKTDEYNLVNNGISSIKPTSTNTFITAYGILPIRPGLEFIFSASKLDNKEATTTKYNLYYIAADIRLMF